MPCEIGAKVVEAVQSRPVRVMIYVGSKIYINEYSNRDFVANYRVEGFHANKIVVEDIAGEIRKNHLNVTKVYALGEREVLEQALVEIRPLPGLTITSSGSDNFEILPAGADKGRALTRLARCSASRRTKWSPSVTATTMRKCSVQSGCRWRWATRMQRSRIWQNTSPQMRP